MQAENNGTRGQLFMLSEMRTLRILQGMTILSQGFLHRFFKDQAYLRKKTGVGE